MSLNRRGFLKLTVAAATVTAFSGLGIKVDAAEKRAYELRTRGAKQTTSVCMYCSLGCGLIVHTNEKTGRAINVEGDPDHPINEGSLCAKGASIFQLAENDKRVTKPQYRAPGSAKWEEKSWDWMYDQIAKRVKDTRDKNFQAKNAKGELVNRVEAIASIGSAALDNEECWLYQHMLRGLGLVYIEHQARI
jgi:formate dehydrogenase major subunit